jgi:hypothetical protein
VFFVGAIIGEATVENKGQTSVPAMRPL